MHHELKEHEKDNQSDNIEFLCCLSARPHFLKQITHEMTKKTIFTNQNSAFNLQVVEQNKTDIKKKWKNQKHRNAPA
jgi:hypothetical protein